MRTSSWCDRGRVTSSASDGRGATVTSRHKLLPGLLLISILASCAGPGVDKAADLSPEMEAWLSAWEQRETVTQPEWAGGREVLRWPVGAETALPREWAEERGFLDRKRAAVVDSIGLPVSALRNESVSGELLLYEGFGLILYDGVCRGWVPRSRAFEEYFTQPDL
ncbi:MAG: hypothetical protein GF400_07405 [Candidatus Eisenbacteria bacterium]|nr:hypothetical protein [Candidatus Eisenbacteria bacterium]